MAGKSGGKHLSHTPIDDDARVPAPALREERAGEASCIDLIMLRTRSGHTRERERARARAREREREMSSECKSQSVCDR